MAITLGKELNIPRKNLILWLDPNDKKSYPGNGDIWYDLTKYKNNFKVSIQAYKEQNGVKYMDFNGSNGIAKTVSQNLLGVTGLTQNHVTYVVWTRIRNSTTGWRTLTRGLDSIVPSYDHHVIIQDGNWNMGYYQTSGAGFNNSGFSQQSVPGNGSSQWVMMHFRYSSTSPYFKISYNDTPEVIRGSSTSPDSSYRVGFQSLGGFGENNTDNPFTASQFWGDIAFFGVWNRELSNAEILDIWNSTASTYGYSTVSNTNSIKYQDNSVQSNSSSGLGSGELISINTYTSGSTTWTKPAGCKKILVSVTGGGGGAAGYCESGGAGGYAEKWVDVTDVSAVAVTVGGGGNSVGYYAGAGNGGTSSFGSYVSASGGYGANQNYSHTGGHGGIGSGGQINLYGGDGTGHANSHGYYPGGTGGGSFWGGSTSVARGTTVSKQANGAPGAGGPGSRTDDGGGGSTAYGENGLVVVYNYK